MDERKDEAIAAAVQRGDFDSFSELVERYEPKMIRYARRFLFDNDDAKDLVQDVFIKAYVKIRALISIADFHRGYTASPTTNS